MLFNSFEFAVFFPVVTILFFLLPHRFRWLLLLLASCFFYMFFKPVYILILIFTIVIDYFAGLWIARQQDKRKRKFLLLSSIVANVGVLVVFKYYNFLAINFNEVFGALHYGGKIPILDIVLPIGLSFHTFQAMSYTVEVYRGNQQPERHFGIYALYVMFYPQLVAGPIERPQHVLHQFHEKKTFNYANLFSGLKRITWGLFKKVVIADRLAAMVDFVYNDVHQYHGLAILLTIILFSIQIYCDFSGYSDIAVGTARVMGFDLMENFNYPLYSKNITEFWRRWHISLSSWFRDYVYIPLGGNKVSKGRRYLNVLIVFLLSGIWHGANWTFLAWGGLHGLAVLTESLTKKQREKVAGWVPPVLYDNISMALTFALVGILWLFFRSPTFGEAAYMLRNVFTAGANGHYFSLSATDLHGLPPSYLGLPLWQFASTLLLIPFLVLSEWLIRNRNTRGFSSMPAYIRWPAYYAIIFSIIFFGLFDTKQFIYFQF